MEAEVEVGEKLPGNNCIKALRNKKSYNNKRKGMKAKN